jgi:cobalt-zinc-cadmium efflux system outer membrane protein
MSFSTQRILAAVRSASLALAFASAQMSAWAQESGPGLSIEQLTQRVLQGNPDLQSAAIARDAARSATVAARALPNPRLDLTGGQAVPRVGTGGTSNVQSFGATQLIESASLRGARIDAAGALERGAGHAVAQTRNDLVAQTRLAAFEALLRQEEAEAASDALRLLEQVRERVSVRVSSGEAPRYELFKADAEIISARQRRDAALIMADKALLDLNRLAGGTLPARWRLAATLDEAGPALVLEQLIREGLERSPELAQLQSEVDRARAQLQAAQASRWPGVDLRVDHSREVDLVQNRIGVSVVVPLLDDRSGVIAQASAELARAQRRLEGRRAELRQNILLGWKSLEMSTGAVDALSRGAVREAESALRVAEAAYRFGERGILEVLDSQRVLRSVRADLLLARFQVQAARVALEQLAARYVDR